MLPVAVLMLLCVRLTQHLLGLCLSQWCKSWFAFSRTCSQEQRHFWIKVCFMYEWRQMLLHWTCATCDIFLLVCQVFEGEDHTGQSCHKLSVYLLICHYFCVHVELWNLAWCETSTKNQWACHWSTPTCVLFCLPCLPVTVKSWGLWGCRITSDNETKRR